MKITPVEEKYAECPLVGFNLVGATSGNRSARGRVVKAHVESDEFVGKYPVLLIVIPAGPNCDAPFDEQYVEDITRELSIIPGA